MLKTSLVLDLAKEAVGGLFGVIICDIVIILTCFIINL